MSDISQIKATRFQEAEVKRHNSQIKKLRNENYRTYTKEAKQQEATISAMKRTHDQNVVHLDNKLEQRLTEIRNKHELRMREEAKRLDAEFNNLKVSHTDKVEEIKENQSLELDRMNESHKNSLEVAETKFERERLKIEAKTA